MSQRDSDLVPIMIRDDLTIWIKGMPKDMRPVEAQKIVNVIMAFVTEPQKDRRP